MSRVENPYETFGMAAHADVDERTTFIRKTYLHLAGAILAFIGIEALIFNIVSPETLSKMVGTMISGWNWLIVIVLFMVVSTIANKWASSAVSLQTQYMGLGLYVVAQAVIFIPLLFIASNYFPDANIIPTAAVVTLLMFAGLTVIVFMTGADFSFLRTALMLGMFAAMILIFGGAIFGFNLGLFFVIAMIALMCGYILYDTSNVLHHYHTTQYVAASLALFASIAMLFWYVIQLMMILSGRD